MKPETQNKKRCFQFPVSSLDSGFTIVELMISLAVFTILMGVVANIFIQSLRTQRFLVSLMAANDNVSLTLEQMAREIRTGMDFCIADSGNGCTLNSVGGYLRFTNADNQIVIYKMDVKAIKRSDDGGVEFFSLTGGNVTVDNLQFVLFQGSGTDVWSPRITISLKAGTTNAQNKFGDVFTDIQTTVSGRNF